MVTPYYIVQGVKLHNSPQFPTIFHENISRSFQQVVKAASSLVNRRFKINDFMIKNKGKDGIPEVEK
ncbi:hypothetical protein JCM17136A_01710 [Phocaeicola sartorii JCM 17136 = DSM 21941]|jgi:hypothetical protein